MKAYVPTGRAALAMRAIRADPNRLWTSRDIAIVMDCEVVNVNNALEVCVAHGLLGRRPGTRVLWGLPEAIEAIDAEPTPEPKPAYEGKVAGSRMHFSTRHNYDGADLKREPPRGAASMHAYTLPSLVGGERTERKRPIIIGAAPQVKVAL